MKNKTLRAKNLQKVALFFILRRYLYIILGKIQSFQGNSKFKMQNAELLEELGVEVVKIKKEWTVLNSPLSILN